jgi:hypothetical protein
MPTNMRTAAVEHCVGRGNGSMLAKVGVAQQLEKATTNNYCTIAPVAGIHYTNCHNRVLKLAAQHCLSHVRSLLRLRGAAGRPGRNRRLRAQTETRSRMPTLRLVNSWGNQLSRNATNSGIDRFDGQRAFLRRAVREVRNKEAVLCLDGTRHRCPLSNITSFAPREATVTQRRLRIPDSSLPVRGLPLNKKTRQNTLQSGPDGYGTSGRAACRTAGERACVAPGTLAADAHWTLVRWLGASASNGHRLHFGAATLQPGTGENVTPGRAACWTAGEHARVAPGKPATDDRWTLGGWLHASATTDNCIRDGDFTSDVHERRVKDAITGHVK